MTHICIGTMSERQTSNEQLLLRLTCVCCQTEFELIFCFEVGMNNILFINLTFVDK